MPTNKPRVTFVIDDALYEQVQNYQFTYRAKNQSQAICELVEIGIKAILAEEAEKQKAAEAADAAPAAVPVNPVEAITDVLCRAGIIKPGEDISDSDLAFLQAIFMAVEAHFQN